MDIAATCLLIHREERQGELISPVPNLRWFLETCKELDMPVWQWIGPWCHGEARNAAWIDC